MDKKIQKKKWTLKRIIIISVISLCLIFGSLLVFNIDGSNKMRIKKSEISIGEVINSEFKDFIAVSGTVEPIQTIYLDATEGGRVEYIFVEEGDMLIEGAKILELSNDKLRLEISNNQAQVERAINDLEQTEVNLNNLEINNKNKLNSFKYNLSRLKRNYENNEVLYKKQFLSKDDYLVSEEGYKSNLNEYNLLKERAKQDSVFKLDKLRVSKISIKRMNQNLDLTRNRLEKLILRSPIKGELALLKPKVGEVISYGNRIGSMNILDSYKLRVEIDEYYISKVRKGQFGNCDISGNNHRVHVTKIYPEVTDGKFFVDMEFKNNIPDDLRIGQTIRIGLELGDSKNSLVISKGGFLQSTGGNWVYKLDKEGSFAYKKSISIGRRNPDQFEILGGLEKGDKIILSGYDGFGEVNKLILE